MVKTIPQLLTLLAIKYIHTLFCTSILYGDMSQWGRIKRIKDNPQNALNPVAASGTQKSLYYFSNMLPLCFGQCQTLFNIPDNYV